MHIVEMIETHPTKRSRQAQPADRRVGTESAIARPSGARDPISGLGSSL